MQMVNKVIRKLPRENEMSAVCSRNLASNQIDTRIKIIIVSCHAPFVGVSVLLYFSGYNLAPLRQTIFLIT